MQQTNFQCWEAQFPAHVFMWHVSTMSRACWFQIWKIKCHGSLQQVAPGAPTVHQVIHRKWISNAHGPSCKTRDRCHDGLRKFKIVFDGQISSHQNPCVGKEGRTRRLVNFELLDFDPVWRVAVHFGHRKWCGTLCCKVYMILEQKKLTSHAYWNQKSVFSPTTSIQAPNWCLASNFVLEFAIGRMTVKARFQCNMRSAQRASWGRATSCASFRYADNNLANQVLSECEWVRLACQSSRQAQ